MKGKLKAAQLSLTITTVAIVSFVAGAIFSQAGWFPQVASVSAADSQADLDVFWEAWNLISNHFIDQDALDSIQLSYVAIDAIVDALGDTGHTRFLRPDQATAHASSIDGEFSGIGARLGTDTLGRPIIIEPFEDSPAQRAGLRHGDILLAIDGNDVTGLSIGAIVEQVRGPQGTSLTVTVRHRNNTELEEFVITREKVNAPVTSWTFIPDSKIALVRLVQFSANSNDEMAEVLQEMQDRGAEAVIVDVRGNPGGLLRQAVAVSSQFLDDGNVLQESDAQGKRREFPVNDGGVAFEIPLVVLVDRGSASSSEIFAGAIQDHGRGLILGETTFGTGTVLTPYTLSDGSLLLLGTSEWLTAEGRSIRNRGIAPDVIVSLAEDGVILSPYDVRQLTEEELFHSKDVQLLEALDLLNNCWDQKGCDQLIGLDVLVGIPAEN